MISRIAPADAPSWVARQAALLLSQLRQTRQRDASFWGATLLSSSPGPPPPREETLRHDANILPNRPDCARDDKNNTVVVVRGLARASLGSFGSLGSEGRARKRCWRWVATSHAWPAGVSGSSCRRRPLGRTLVTSATTSASKIGDAATQARAAAGRKVRAVSTLKGAWEATKDDGAAPDRESYRAAIQACGGAGGRQCEEALALLAEMMMMGLAPDIRCYNAALGACAEEGRWEQALTLLRKLQAKGVEPDVASYNAVLTACGNAKPLKPRSTPLRDNSDAGAGRAAAAAVSGETSKSGPLQPCTQALSLLSEMWDGGSATPTDESYGACITACGNSGRQWKQVMALMREVNSRKGVTPGARSYTAAIKAGRNGYRWRQTLALLREMREREKEDEEEEGNGTRGTREGDTPIFNAAITACKNGGDWRHALSLLEDMGNLGVRRDVTSYNEVIRALRQQRRKLRRPEREEAAVDTSS